jgi:hypothetical protein
MGFFFIHYFILLANFFESDTRKKVDDIMAGSFAVWQSKTILGTILARDWHFNSFRRADEKLTAFIELESRIRRGAAIS